MKIKKSFSIAFFLPSLEAGGAERNVVNIVNNLDRQKYNISLVLAEAKGDFLSKIEKDVPIINLNVSGDLKLFFRLIKYFRNEGAGIFISAFPRFNAISLLAQKISGRKIKIVLTEHLSFFLIPKTARTFSHRFIAQFLFPSFIRIFYPAADAIICVSKGIGKELSELTNRSDKIKVIYNPVADDKIQGLAEKEVSHPWFSDSKIPLIIMAARLSRTKDQPTLFKALSLILKERFVRLAIVGDGTEKYKLKQLAEKLGLSENIAFLGFQENPYKYMKNASVFVLSSLQEGFGNVIVEAMACGTPVVATDCKSGPGEIIQDGINGLLVPPKDEKALAEAILKILNNPSLAEKFSLAGKSRAECFSIKKSLEEYEKIFETLAN